MDLVVFMGKHGDRFTLCLVYIITHQNAIASLWQVQKEAALRQPLLVSVFFCLRLPVTGNGV